METAKIFIKKEMAKWKNCTLQKCIAVKIDEMKLYVDMESLHMEYGEGKYEWNIEENNKTMHIVC